MSGRTAKKLPHWAWAGVVIPVIVAAFTPVPNALVAAALAVALWIVWHEKWGFLWKVSASLLALATGALLAFVLVPMVKQAADREMRALIVGTSCQTTFMWEAGGAVVDGAIRMQWGISHDSKYPCYDVTVSVENITARLAWMRAEREAGRVPFPSFEPDQFTKIYSVGTIGPGPRSVDVFSFAIRPDQVEQDLRVTTTSRSGGETTLRLRRVDGRWQQKIRSILIEDGKSRVLRDDG